MPLTDGQRVNDSDFRTGAEHTQVESFVRRAIGIRFEMRFGQEHQWSPVSGMGRRRDATTTTACIAALR